MRAKLRDSLLYHVHYNSIKPLASSNARIWITQPSLLKSKAEVRAKLRDSLLYHVHYNSIKPVLPGSPRFQPVPTNQSGGCKALTALLETSITDGLKSRLTQYLKHVVEDDVLFTNSNPLHTPPFWLNIVLDVPKLKITQTHIPHTYTSQIIFFVLCTLSVRVNNPWPNAICFVLKVQNCHLVSLIVLVPQ